MSQADETPYANLSPDLILTAIEAFGFRCDGHLLALNSYENRVYQVGLDDGTKIIAKFYRPARLSDAAILEEHAFIAELVRRRTAVRRAAPRRVGPNAAAARRLSGSRCFRAKAATRRISSRKKTCWCSAGRWRAFIESAAAAASNIARNSPSVRLGVESREFVLQHDFVPDELIDAYTSVTTHLLTRIDALALPAGGRIHGDCHPGNVLWRDEAPHFVDFDDTVMGPAVQDLWMLLSGEREEQTRSLIEAARRL